MWRNKNKYNIKLLSEIKSQFNLREWLDAIKQGIKELFNQWSISEWAKAFFAYMPTATGKRINGKVRTINGGTSSEIFDALTKLQKEVR